MKPIQTQLRQQAEEHAAATRQTVSEQQVREFGSVEELLRHDAAQHPPPPGLGTRIQVAAGREPGPARSWWRRWLKWFPKSGQ